MKTEAEKRLEEKQVEEKEKMEQADLKLDYWLKGHVTGADKPEDDKKGGKPWLPSAPPKLMLW